MIILVNIELYSSALCDLSQHQAQCLNLVMQIMQEGYIKFLKKAKKNLKVLASNYAFTHMKRKFTNDSIISINI